MEPPPFGDGNDREAALDQPPQAASMEPPPFGDGNSTRPSWRSRRITPASMEPPPFGDGNWLAGHTSLPDGMASMEPPPFGDGNQKTWQDGLMPMLLQWSHRLSAMETSTCNDSADRFDRCFNGATAFRRWKLVNVNRNGANLERASMEPPPFGDGNTALQDVTNASDKASMEPPPFGDGNSQASPTGAPSDTPLQWSHRLSAMETREQTHAIRSADGRFNGATAFRRWKPPDQWRQRAYTLDCFNGATAFRRWKPMVGVQRASQRLLWKRVSKHTQFDQLMAASMEPPPFGDGNLPTNGSTCLHTGLLQWSHRLSAMETAIFALTRTQVVGSTQYLPSVSPQSVSAACRLDTHFQEYTQCLARGAAR